MYEPDKIDKEYLAEMARILGHSEGHEKLAAVKKPLPPAKPETRGVDAKLSKIASMPLREIVTDANYQRGFNDEIEARRSVWEPAVVAWLRGEE